MKTSLIIPVYNEEKAITSVVEEYLPYVDEIIIVDDGSTDSTQIISLKLEMEYRKVKVFSHKYNSGKVAAIRSGIFISTGDIIILTDGDCTYPAKYVPQLIEAINNGSDLVIGTRNNKNMSPFNLIGNKIFSSIASYVSCINVSDAQSGMRAFKKDLFPKLDVSAVSLEWETKMTVKAAKLGYRIIEIPIEYRKRVGKSKLNPIKDGFKMFKALINISFNEIPTTMKIFMIIGFLAILGGFYTGIMTIQETLNWKLYNLPRIHVYYPIITVFAILLGVFLFSTTLFSNYVVNKLNRIEDRLIKK